MALVVGKGGDTFRSVHYDRPVSTFAWDWSQTSGMALGSTIEFADDDRQMKA